MARTHCGCSRALATRTRFRSVAIIVVGLALSIAACAPTPGAPDSTPAVAPVATATAALATAPSAPASPTGSSVPAAGPITWAPRAPVACTEADGELRVQSGDRIVRGKLFRPSSGGPHPALLVLHTRGGPSAHVDGQAAYFASQGYVAFAPDYHAAIGITPRDVDALFFLTHTDAIREHLARAIDCLRARPEIAPDRVGAVGFSSGGYFAVLLATREGTAAAASWYGSAPGGPSILPARYTFAEVASQVRAPVLILHGDADTEINPNVARRAQAELRRQGKRSDLVMYPGLGHGFDIEGAAPVYVYDARATQNARARTLELLRETLR